MNDRPVPPLDLKTEAAIAEVRARTPSKIAKGVKTLAGWITFGAVGGAVAAHVGWLAAQWEGRLLTFFFALGAAWIGIDQYYRVKGNIRAGRPRWSSIAVGLFLVFEFGMRGSHYPDPLFRIALGVIPTLFAITLFVDEWQRPRANPAVPRRLTGVTIFGIGAIATGALASVGRDLPEVPWQQAFFTSVAFLAVGALMMYRDRQRREKPALWERPTR